MRYFIAVMALCCTGTVGYATEAEPQDAPSEVVIIEEPGSNDSENVAIGVDSKKDEKPKSGGCGCGGK